LKPEGGVPLRSPIRSWERNVIIDSKIAGGKVRRNLLQYNGKWQAIVHIAMTDRGVIKCKEFLEYLKT
jgi:hypothetical protein